jgi:glycosyltransferase involved in cell wall biosynthesis
MTSSASTPGNLAAHLDVETPVAVRVIELEQGLPDLQLSPARTGKPYRSLLALIRVDRSPVGWISCPLTADGNIPQAELVAVSESLAALGSGLPGKADPPPVANSPLSVVVTTCAEESVVRCVERIVSDSRRPLEVIVVENRPQRSTVESALRKRFGDDESIRYVEESRPGLSFARNAGLREAQGEIVAFTDDDIDVDCVTGLILPLELENPVQLLIERFASFGKGFTPRVYSLSAPPLNQPLFPYAAGHFGSGANMAFRVSSIRELGGFDSALGAGTPARGGEDLDICIRTLRDGKILAYEPKAIVWHRHPDTSDRLRRQAFEYGVGLGAMLGKHILFGPDRWEILSRAPRGVRYFRDPSSRKNVARGPRFPRALSRLERIGVLFGPIAYLASRVRARA